jgi:hypothetical protein
MRLNSIVLERLNSIVLDAIALENVENVDRDRAMSANAKNPTLTPAIRHRDRATVKTRSRTGFIYANEEL